MKTMTLMNMVVKVKTIRLLNPIVTFLYDDIYIKSAYPHMPEKPLSAFKVQTTTCRVLGN